MKQVNSVHERVSACAQLKPEQIFSAYHFSAEGLTDDAAGEQRRLYGENRILGQKKDSTAYRLRRAFLNPFSVVLLLLAIISFFTDVLFATDQTRNHTTALIIVIMLVGSGVVRLVQEMRSKKVTDRLVRLIHTTVQVKRDGVWQERSSGELVVGDLVRLDAGDRVPADIRLLSTRDFFVSQSVITGESGIQEKQASPLSEHPTRLGGYHNSVFLGTTVAGGKGEGIVLAVGEDSVYGGISFRENERKQGFDRGENAIAWVLIKFMAFLVPIVFVACGLTKNNWLEAFIFALSVAVGLTPELLPMVASSCLARGTFQMGKKQTIVKNSNAMQGFGNMDTLCVDKTGTLTRDRVVLEYYMDVLGNESWDTLDVAYLNSYYHTGVSNHLDQAILGAKRMPGKGQHFKELLAPCRKLDELPFDYSRKFASVLLREEGRNLLLVKGSIDQVVERCSYIRFHGQRHAIDAQSVQQSVAEIVDEMLEDGMKVLAVAAREMDKDLLAPEDEYGLTLLGYLAFFDGPKQSASSAIKKLQDLRIGIRVLTGDHLEVATSICRRIGVPTTHVLTGQEFDALTENDLPVVIERTTIFAELSPRQKAKIVEILQDNGHRVGFLGDGMNDLPAIVQADVGISVDTAADAVKESADVILLKKSLDVLEEGVLEGRKAFANMSKYIKITASSNFGNICAIVVASIFLPFFPMTSLQLLLLNLLYDILCLILPWDNVDAEMFEKPLEWSGRLLGRFMGFFGPISTAFDLFTFGFLYFFLCPMLCGGAFGSLDGAQQLRFIALFQTGWFLESMWTQVLIIQLLRTRQLPFVQSKPSPAVLGVTVLGIVLFSVLTITPPGAWMGLTAMPGQYYIYLILVVLLYLLLVSLAKIRYIKKYRKLI